MSKTKNRKIRQLHVFHKRVAALDRECCRNPECLSAGDTDRLGVFTAHHIRYRSKRGTVNVVENGIMLCWKCHVAVHNGHDGGGDRLSGRQFMLKILDDLIDGPGYRWHEVHEELRRRYAA